jgi:hypothetical protein
VCGKDRIEDLTPREKTVLWQQGTNLKGYGHQNNWVSNKPNHSLDPVSNLLGLQIHSFQLFPGPGREREDPCTHFLAPAATLYTPTHILNISQAHGPLFCTNKLTELQTPFLLRILGPPPPFPVSTPQWQGLSLRHPLLSPPPWHIGLPPHTPSPHTTQPTRLSALSEPHIPCRAHPWRPAHSQSAQHELLHASPHAPRPTRSLVPHSLRSDTPPARTPRAPLFRVRARRPSAAYTGSRGQQALRASGAGPPAPHYSPARGSCGGAAPGPAPDAARPTRSAAEGRAGPGGGAARGGPHRGRGDSAAGGPEAERCRPRSAAEARPSALPGPLPGDAAPARLERPSAAAVSAAAIASPSPEPGALAHPSAPAGAARKCGGGAAAWGGASSVGWDGPGARRGKERGAGPRRGAESRA